MQKDTFQVEMPSVSIGRDWLIGEPTRLLDRFVPIVQETLLPTFDSAQGSLKLSLDSSSSISNRTANEPWKKKLKKIVRGDAGPSSAPSDLVCIDLRTRHPGNWAHAFTNHLPLALFIANQIGLNSDQICVVLPKATPKKIIALFELVSFLVILEDGPVVGRFCHFELEPWISLRGPRCEILKESLKNSKLREEISAKIGSQKKVFISRRDQRKLENEKEVQDYLDRLGYEKIYPEDYDLLEQIALICGADNIVAVHGAGLGPLILKSMLDEQPYKLLEIFSPAHITNVYRMIAHQTGGEWVGVRGNIWPELLGGEENFVGNMKDFLLSIESLERALEIQNTQC